jgi:hypothetical protein
MTIIIIGCSEINTPPPHALNLNQYGFCLTFDDAYVNDWNKILPILDSNDIKATFFITQAFKLTESQIGILRIIKNHGHEIGSHGWQHINALSFLTNNSIEEYVEKEIVPSINYLDSLGLYPETFSYPYRYNCDSLETVLLQYFRLLRDVTDEQRVPLKKAIEEIDEIYFKFQNEKIISALGIDANFNVSLEMLEAGFKRSLKNNEVIVLYVDRPVKNVNSPYQIELDYLRSLIELAKLYKLQSYSFSELAN